MHEPTSRLDEETFAFVVEQYNDASAFSNFLPAIAGPWGIPLWCYYVNRGQAVCSAGVHNKDGQIIEFQSFNQACARVDREGFRTFVRLGELGYEPFQRSEDERIIQRLTITPGELSLFENNPDLGLDFEVTYFTLPNMRCAGLVRRVKITNRSRREKQLEWIDGAARVLPYGMNQNSIKGTPRHSEGMMGVTLTDNAARYRLKQTADDSEKIGLLSGSFFYLRANQDRKAQILADPDAIFAEPFHYEYPVRFFDEGLDAVLAETQFLENKTPSAFSAQKTRLGPGQSTELFTILGYASQEKDLSALKLRAQHPDFFREKRLENNRLVGEIAARAFTASASPSFDAYCQQNFLDNVVRGGMPLALDCRSKKSAVYLYSRQNGDLERDYHFFVLEPTYLSQGTGHYRSVLQNRRMDSWFFPEVEEVNVRTFMNLLQLDGYNPLEVRGVRYRVADENKARIWAGKRITNARARTEMLEWMATTFSPGELVMKLEDATGLAPNRRMVALEEVLSFCDEEEIGGLHEGFWVDHWHYNLDLLLAFFSVHPERQAELLLNDKSYTFFDNPDVILPRDKRTVDSHGRIRSYGAVHRDPEKLEMIAARSLLPHTARDGQGHGEPYRTSLIVKWLTVVTNRLATLDPAGTGIEMEASKPGWNDSMNGLPGLFGSGLSETLELYRACRFFAQTLQQLRPNKTRAVMVFEELAEFVQELLPLMKTRASGRSQKADFLYWQESNTLKESYRKKTRLGVNGNELRMPLKELIDFFKGGEALLERLFSGKQRRRLLSEKGVPYTYFVNDVTAFESRGETTTEGTPLVKATEFEQRPVKLFLEGPMHWLKVRPEEAKRVHDAVRKSPLFDKKLRMYKSCENMRGESHELGRAVGAYPRGWIENESIYLHMEYKYLLEMLRSGLAEEFWSDAKSALVPFMDPEVYGRSVTEGASFIVSSAYPDARLHGRAFQPRLSGITCEFLEMWAIAVAGPKPLGLDRSGKLELRLEPRLPGWLFSEKEQSREYFDPAQGWTKLTLPENGFAFKFLGKTLVVYENRHRKNTFGPGAARIKQITTSFRSGRQSTLGGRVLPARIAKAVRAGDVARLDVVLR